MLSNAVRQLELRRDRQRRGKESVTAIQRTEWAAAIRAPMKQHPRQWTFAQSDAPLKAVCGNRRAGKTEGVGREVAARLIEQNEYTVWVFAKTLKAFDRNWMSRGRRRAIVETSDDHKSKTGMLRLLDDFGVPYLARKSSDGAVSEVSFPWGSVMQVLPAADPGQLESARGGLFDLLWLDEAQSMPLVVEILEEMGGPAGADYDAPLWLTGTPGEEVGSFFHRVVAGDIEGWEVHDFTSCDNPHFGDDWRSRFERAVLIRVQQMREIYRVGVEEMAKLATLTEEDFTLTALNALPWVANLPPKVQREYLRLWVADPTSLIYPSAHIEPYVYCWGAWSEHEYVLAAAVGIGQDKDTLCTRVTGWHARMDLLPKTVGTHGKLHSKHWNLAIGVDLGKSPDHFAITLQAWSSTDPCMYEIDSAKANDMRGDQQLDVVRMWITAARTLPFCKLWGIVIDDDGGNTPAQVDGWRHKLAPLLPPTGIMDAYKPKKDMQHLLLNDERSSGRVRILRHGPLWVEEQYLQREPYDPQKPGKKRDVNKHRKVNVMVRHESGRRESVECMPGDHACDARRYIWYKATHIHGREAIESDERLSHSEWRERQINQHRDLPS